MIKIIESTDNKYIGVNLDENDNVFILNGWHFKPTKIQELNSECFRYSNSEYIILTKLIK